MKKGKWIIIGVVGLVVLYAAFANLDHRGVERTCATATAVDTEGRRYSYRGSDGESHSWEFPGQGKLLGLQPGESIGLSYCEGRLSGMLYEVKFYLLDDNQRGRVTEFHAQRSGTGAYQRATGRRTSLPIGCPTRTQ